MIDVIVVARFLIVSSRCILYLQLRYPSLSIHDPLDSLAILRTLPLAIQVQILPLEGPIADPCRVINLKIALFIVPYCGFGVLDTPQWLRKPPSLPIRFPICLPGKPGFPDP